MNRAYCSKCCKDVIYSISERPTVQVIWGRKYNFTERVAHCNNCDTELHIQALAEENKHEYDKEFRKINGIIEPEKLDEIMVKYDIKKSTLALVLGWGVNTFSRHCNGVTPSRPYSDVLLQIYDDPDCFIRYLEKNKNLIPQKSYMRSLSAALKHKGIDTTQNDMALFTNNCLKEN